MRDVAKQLRNFEGNWNCLNCLIIVKSIWFLERIFAEIALDTPSGNLSNWNTCSVFKLPQTTEQNVLFIEQKTSRNQRDLH